jgi:hypothetical protein
MKKTALALAALLCLVTAVNAFASKPAPTKPAMHGHHAHGIIATVDDSAKSFVLREGKTNRTIFWTDATKVTGGTVKPLEKADVRWMAHEGKNVATSVKIAAK